MDKKGEVNEKVMKAFLVVYIVCAIILLAMIWFPKVKDDTPDFAYYKKYTQEDVANKMSQYYTNDIFTKVILGEQLNIANYISKDYLEYYGLTKEDIATELNQFGLNLYKLLMNIN